MGGNFCSPVDEHKNQAKRNSHLSTPALAPRPKGSKSRTPSPRIGEKFRASQRKKKRQRPKKGAGNPLLLGLDSLPNSNTPPLNPSDQSSSPGDSLPLTKKSKGNSPKIDNKKFLMAQRRGFQGYTEEEEGEWDEEYFFLVLSDPQLGMWNRIMEEDFSRKCVKIINELQPRFVVVCGDMTHTLSQEDRKKRADELKTFKQIYSKVEDHIPLICVCGNQDVGDKPTPYSISQYNDEFGDDHYSFWVGGVKYIVFNSQTYSQRTECERIARAQDTWMDGELASSGDAVHRVAFCHIPPFISEPDEDDGYFNMPEKCREEVLDKLLDAEVSHLFCGHYHRNAGGVYKDELEVVTTAAVGTNIAPSQLPDADPLDKSGIGEMLTEDDHSGFRIVCVKKDQIQHKYFTFDDIKEEFNEIITTKEMVFDALNDTMAGAMVKALAEQQNEARESYFNPYAASFDQVNAI